jgi:hypothetical protein
MIKLRESLAKRLNDTQKVQIGTHTLEEMLAELQTFQEEDWGKYAFRHDPLERKFSSEQKAHYTRAAMECGKNEAVKLMRESEYSTVEALAVSRGLHVEYPETPAGSGAMVFAQYTEPNKIEVFEDCIQRAEKTAREEEVSDMPGSAELKEILLAHEFFHWIEYKNKKTIYTQTEKVELWRKPFSNKSNILALSEMAAMSFAKSITGSHISPYLLDVLLVYGYNKEAACALYEEMMETAGRMERIWEDVSNNHKFI